MKTFLQNLLIFFSLCLCGLIAFQWVRETDLRKERQALYDRLHDRDETIQNLNSTVKHDEQEIQRLDNLKNQLTQTVKSNDTQIFNLTRDLEKATNTIEKFEHELAVYKDALQTANDSIKKQNEDIKRQNEEMKQMIEDRKDLVKRFNEVATNYNELVLKWNTQQEELRKAAATNAPPKK
jgi:chromosome segregation ATPase